MATRTVADIAITSLLSITFCFIMWRSNKWSVVYILPPIVLMWVNLVGSTMQEQEIGPMWARNHLHNLGAAYWLMASGFLLTVLIKFELLKSGHAIVRLQSTVPIMKGVLLGWTFGTFMCVGYEVMMVSALREQNLAKGYSGEVDWLDLLAYAIAQAVMTANYLWVRPWVLSKARRDLGVVA